MKSPIGLIFCRNMLMDSLQGQLKNCLAEGILYFSSSDLSKITQGHSIKSSHSEEKVKSC